MQSMRMEATIILFSGLMGAVNCGLMPSVPAEPLPTITNALKSTVTEALSCLTSGPFDDHRIGHFDNDDPAYCDLTCLRLPFLCCVPQKPDDMHVKYRLYTSRSPDPILIDWDDEAASDHFTSGRVVFIIHGGIETIDDVWINDAKDAWLSYDPMATVITVDWREANQLFYVQVVANIRTVGAMVGYSVWKWKIWGRANLVGFSFGAHISSEAGRFVQSKRHLIENCTGLDPAGIFFDGCSDKIRLKPSDCRLVEIVHSSGSPRNSMTLTLGTNRRSGHCDYYVTTTGSLSSLFGRACGYTQESCSNPDIQGLTSGLLSLLSTLNDNFVSKWLFDIEVVCSHFTAPKAYIERLKAGDSAHKCPLCSTCGVNFFAECGPDAQQETAEAKSLPPDSGCDPMKNKQYILYRP